MPQRKDGGDAILEALRKLDVDYIISSPGSEWPSVWEALARQEVNEEPGPKYINTWHETLAVAMAQGYTRMTGRMQAVLLHAGVGVLQGSMGIHGAFQGEIPMIVASGETATYGEQDDFDPGPQWLRNLSIVGGPNRLVDSITKWSSRVTSAEVLYETFSRAGEMAQRTPKGPTFLNVPMETMLEEWIPPTNLRNKPAAPKTRPESSDVEAIADLVIKAKNPVILADSAGKTAEGFQAMITLAESLNIPVFESEGPGYSNFPHNHPLHNGYDLKQRYTEFDVFLVVGTRAPWYPASNSPVDSTVIVIDENPIKEFMVYQDLGADHYLEGDLAASLELLSEAIKSKGGQPKAVASNTGVWERYRAISEDAANASPIDVGVLCNALSDNMPSDSIYIDETINKFGFRLTNDQNISLNEINYDLSSRSKMFRILQGDVGSGKTIVALLSCLNVIEAGYQVAFMAPTEILSNQHYRLAKKIFPKKINISLITSKTINLTKKKILSDLENSKIQIIT